MQECSFNQEFVFEYILIIIKLRLAFTLIVVIIENNLRCVSFTFHFICSVPSCDFVSLKRYSCLAFTGHVPSQHSIASLCRMFLLLATCSKLCLLLSRFRLS